LQIEVCGLTVNYESCGEGRDVIVLHGWGASIAAVKPIVNKLSNNFKVYALDLPGFGRSQLPGEVWGTPEYAGLVKAFIEKLNIEKPIIIGHSFGGKIAIYLTGKLGVEAQKMILIDSAGIKKKRTLTYYYRVYTFKLLKLIVKTLFSPARAEQMIENARKRHGSTDYKNAAGLLRQIMVKIVNEDLRNYLPQIKAPTLLIWGENDGDTPVADGRIMEKLIPDAGLVVLSRAGHFSYLDKEYEFNVIIQNFLKPEMESK